MVLHPPLLVLVGGPPGTGKSTLARRLAEDLALPVLGKDGMKEALAGDIGARDLAKSEALGQAAVRIDTTDGYRPDYAAILAFARTAHRWTSACPRKPGDAGRTTGHVGGEPTAGGW